MLSILLCCNYCRYATIVVYVLVMWALLEVIVKLHLMDLEVEFNCIKPVTVGVYVHAVTNVRDLIGPLAVPIIILLTLGTCTSEGQ